MKIAVIRFPGTNNEYETIRAIESFSVSTELVDYKQTEQIPDFDGYWLAGGFSYADVLRAGAIASQSEIVKEISASGKPVFGVCNGFQILTEAKLLPGALLPNISTRFVCKWIHVKLDKASVFETDKNVLKLPIAHFEGNLYQDPHRKSNPFIQYSNERGEITVEANPNGSERNIAGLIEKQFMGMMPHPERAAFKHQGSTDGRIIIGKFLQEAKQ